ncbi:hypothetical protein E6W39_28725 [Kitasatospora acidiphila]|uniref:Uncharacterized protein n=1 Tax=Kitasatospora acidiphila TaxID=2567942 RepID=A0A540W8Y8_9ACTN|nr:DUF6086 family protein [Kitasatospora acidiphila]TQF05490.1 hypothetical protein E6W39_28725 [Kitasatospora acidiphila]
MHFARLFIAEAEAVASVLGLASGVGEIISDECELELPLFEAFVAELVRRHGQSNHPILRSLIVSVAATGSVLVERAGGQLPTGDAEQTAAWAQLRQEHAQSMVR